MRRLPSNRGPRSFGRSKVCVLLILGIGFVFIFLYHGQTHHFGIPHGKYFQNGSSLGFARGKASNLSSRIDDSNSRRITIQSQKIPGNSSHSKASRPPPPPYRTPYVKKDSRDFRIDKHNPPAVASDQATVRSAKFRFVIKVLSLNNQSSLAKCLDSLSQAKYTGDEVDIYIYIDHFNIKESDNSEESRRRSLGEEAEQGTAPPKDNDVFAKSIDEDTGPEHDRISTLPDRITSDSESVDRSDWNLIEQKLEDVRQVLEYAETFHWRHGKKFIHYSTATTGSQSQWLDAWWPSSNDEFALFVEDDAEVSPVYYRYVRELIATYYYEPSNFDSSVYGISLQRAQIVPGKLGRPVRVNHRSRLFKYQMVGTWGQVFFPKPWKEFREWYDSKKNHDAKPVVDGMVTTEWYERHGEAIFTPWFVKFAYNRGYFNLYTNFLEERVLSVTHREFQGNSNKHADSDAVLLWKNGTYDLDLWHMASAWNIKRYDCCFREIKYGRFAKTFAERELALRSFSKSSSQSGKEIFMVSTFGVPEVLVKNWVCRAQTLNIANYILVGEDSDLMEDMARRGYFSMFVDNKQNLTSTIEKEARIIGEVLKFGYAVWLTRADTIWDKNPIRVLEPFDTEGSDVIGLEDSSSALNLVFLRSTNLTVSLWQSLREDLAKIGVNDSRADVWDGARHKFVKGFKSEARGRILKLENIQFIEVLEEKLPKLAAADLSTDSGMARVPVLEGWGPWLRYELKVEAEALGLWNLDDDWACSKLTC